jgi:hypothetical protein
MIAKHKLIKAYHVLESGAQESESVDICQRKREIEGKVLQEIEAATAADTGTCVVTKARLETCEQRFARGNIFAFCYSFREPTCLAGLTQDQKVCRPSHQ